MTYPAGLYIVRNGNWRRGSTLGPPADGGSGLDLQWPYGAAGTYEPTTGKVGLPSTVDPDTLEVYDGPSTISTSNLAFRRVRFNQFITISANVSGIVFDQCHFAGGNPAGFSSAHGLLYLLTGASALVKDSLFKPTTPSEWVNGILAWGSVTIERCEITQICDGFDTYAGTSAMKGSWVHGYMYQSPSTSHSDNQTHNDGWQMQGGTGHVCVGNLLEAYADMDISVDQLGLVGNNNRTGSCMVIKPDASDLSDLTITDNWMHGGKQGIGIADAAPTRYITGTIDILRNRFGDMGGAGPLVANTTATVDTGDGTADANIDEATGNPIVLGG